MYSGHCEGWDFNSTDKFSLHWICRSVCCCWMTFPKVSFKWQKSDPCKSAEQQGRAAQGICFMLWLKSNKDWAAPLGTSRRVAPEGNLLPRHKTWNENGAGGNFLFEACVQRGIRNRQGDVRAYVGCLVGFLWKVSVPWGGMGRNEVLQMLHLSFKSIFSLCVDGSGEPENISRSCGLLVSWCLVVSARSCAVLYIATYFQICKTTQPAE